MRVFESGATRNDDADRIDYEGFLSPFAMQSYGGYMHKHRTQADGKLRASDNWQKGIPVPQYMKSAFRHFMAVWRGHRVGKIEVDDLCALLFNVMGMLHELTKPGGLNLEAAGRDDKASPGCETEQAAGCGLVENVRWDGIGRRGAWDQKNRRRAERRGYVDRWDGSERRRGSRRGWLGGERRA